MQSLRVIYQYRAGRLRVVPRTTCDSYLATAGFHFGRAQIYAGNNTGTGKYKVRSALSSMRQAARGGLTVALDGYTSRRVNDKMCCSFGSPTSWSPVMAFRSTMPVAAYGALRAKIQTIARTATVSCSGPGGSLGRVARGSRHGGNHGGAHGGTTYGGGKPTGGHTRPPRVNRGFSGPFNTSYGVVAFTGARSGRLATYGTDNGRIFGTNRGGVVAGTWVENGSNRRCKTKRFGSFYWGTLRFVLRGDKFTGRWSYCRGKLTRAWSGSRRK